MFLSIWILQSAVAWYITWFQVNENMVKADSKFIILERPHRTQYKYAENYFRFEVQQGNWDTLFPS